MSDLVKKISDFVTGKDIDSRHEKMSDAFKQAQNSQQIWAQTNEITRLRADLAAVTVERDRLREALKRIDGMAVTICMRADAGYGMSVETVMPIYKTARAALEGVTEPASLWQHKKTGGIYEIVGECQIEATNTPGVLYRNTSTGVTWVRPKKEFFDGRFVEWRKSEPPNLPR